MSEKRRGLGRGLGALIPTAPEGSERHAGGERPADLFFGQARSTATEVTGRPEAGAANLDGIPAHVAALAAPSVDDRTTEAVSPGGATANGTGANGTNANGTTNATGTNASGTNPSGTNAGGTDANDVGASGDAGGGTNGAASAATSQVRPASSDTDGLLPVPGARFAELPVGDISPNPRQPRTVFDEDALTELVGSIKEIGVLQPVVVRQVGDRYELIMGERRWRATQEAGLSTIPAIIRDTDDEDLLRDALLENLHRSQLNALEEAAAYQQLLDDFGCTHEQLASRISRSRPQISNTLRLLKLPPLVQRRVAAGVLSAGHARALLGLNDGAAIERLAQRIVAEGLSVRAVEEIVALGGDAAPQRRTVPRAGIRNEALDDLASRLSDKFETRVKVSLGKQRGRLTVEFASVQDLNRILASLAPEDPGLLKG
jgi:ParB family transcriptional regulator, chromosome partitioning protein